MKRVAETVYNGGSEEDSREVLDEELFACLRLLRDAGPDARKAVETAYVLGGREAVRDFVEPLLREAQGELAGGCSGPEETT